MIASTRNSNNNNERDLISQGKSFPSSSSSTTSRANYYPVANADENNNIPPNNTSRPHSSQQQHRSNSAPKRSNQIEDNPRASSSSSHRKLSNTTPETKVSSSKEEQQLTYEYEDAVKKLDELSPKSKGILKTIMKTMAHPSNTIENGNSDNTTNANQNNINNTNMRASSSKTITREQHNREKQQQQSTNTNNNTIRESSSSSRTINEVEKMATVNFTTEPSSSNRGGVISGEERPGLRRTVSSIPEVTKSKRTITNRVVTINVGGQTFQTTSKTLRGCESLFSLVFSERDTVMRDDNGHVFIDRDPKHFRYILNYLRDGKLIGKWNEIASDILEKITHEAKYFKLPGIINDIEECRVLNASFDPRTLEEECQLRFYNQEVVKKTESGSLFACLDYHINKQLVECCKDPFRYFVKFLLRYGESSNLAIGVTCKQTNRWNRFEVMKKIKEKDTIAIWYNYQTEHLILYWNDVEVQRKTFKINSHDWVFHVEMFTDDNFCGLRLVQHQGIHPSQIEHNEEEEEEEDEEPPQE